MRRGFQEPLMRRNRRNGAHPASFPNRMSSGVFETAALGRTRRPYQCRLYSAGSRDGLNAREEAYQDDRIDGETKLRTFRHL
jgi:hypothetical protein